MISISLEQCTFRLGRTRRDNAPPLTAVDPVYHVSVTFPDLSDGGELFQNNLIMPGQNCPFLIRDLPPCSSFDD